MLLKIVGSNIRKHRKKMGLVIAELAHRSGLDDAQLGKIELGKYNPSLRVLRSITRVLPVDLYELFDEGGTYPTLTRFIERTLPLRDSLRGYDPLLLLDLFGEAPLDKITVKDIEDAAK